MVKAKLYLFLQSRTCDLFIVNLIFLNVLLVILETVPMLNKNFAPFFRYIEIVSVSIFTIELLSRLWACTENPKFKHPIKGRIKFLMMPLPLIDFCAIAPFFLPMFFTIDLRLLRALRLFRVFRIIKVGRYLDALQTLVQVFKIRKEEFGILAMMASVFLLISSALIYHFEWPLQKEHFGSIPQTLWWNITTLTSGSQIKPISTVGLTIFVISNFLLKISIFALPAGITASGLLEVIKQKPKPKLKKSEIPTEKMLSPFSQDHHRYEPQT